MRTIKGGKNNWVQDTHSDIRQKRLIGCAQTLLTTSRKRESNVRRKKMRKHKSTIRSWIAKAVKKSSESSAGKKNLLNIGSGKRFANGYVKSRLAIAEL